MIWMASHRMKKCLIPVQSIEWSSALILRYEKSTKKRLGFSFATKKIKYEMSFDHRFGDIVFAGELEECVPVKLFAILLWYSITQNKVSNLLRPICAWLRKRDDHFLAVLWLIVECIGYTLLWKFKRKLKTGYCFVILFSHFLGRISIN